MIIVTGAAGFIGSNIVSELNKSGYNDIVAVDLEDKVLQCPYLKDKRVKNVAFDDLEEFINDNHQRIQAIVHMGACSDTTETDPAVFEKYNLNSSKMLWQKCTEFGLIFIYASSAATYGDGSHGYTDSPTYIKDLEPLNMYGQSKHDFDLWVKSQDKTPAFWAGLKFFNVYGPNENHKGRMASVVRHAYFQIKETGKMMLFRSHRDDFKDGEQTRDFVYVKDAARVVQYLIEERSATGIYNVGVGIGRSFNELVTETFRALDLPVNIEYKDTPIDIRDKYQYYTCADITRLRRIGFVSPMTPLEEGVEDYVKNYLSLDTYN